MSIETPQEKTRSDEELKAWNKKQFELAAQVYAKLHPNQPFTMTDAMNFWTNGRKENFSAIFSRLDKIIGFENITVEDLLEYSE